MKAHVFGCLLVLVVSVHWLTLNWLHQQVQVFQPMQSMAQPMFTRLLTPVSPLPAPPPRARAPARLVKPAPVEPTDIEPRAQAGKEIASVTPTQPSVAEPPVELLVPPTRESSAAPLPQSAPTADAWPADTRLSYNLTGNYRGALYGSAQVMWQREQSHYQVRLDLSLAPLLGVSMISQGEVTDAGLVPGAYEERYPTRVQHVLFEDGYVKFENGARLLQPAAVQDTVSQFVELTHRFSSGREELKVGAEVRVWLARPQGMALWTYDVVEEEPLQIAQLGWVPAFHLQPRPIINPQGVITAEMWFAPSLQYLPVRVRIALDAGNFVDLLVLRIEQGATPAAQPPDAPGASQPAPATLK